jgi:hypothetical protein
MARAEPEPQAVPLVPGDDVQMQVRDRLAYHVVDQDHRAVRAKAVLDRPLQALRRGEELSHPVGGQVAQQADVQLGHEQGVAAEQRPVVKEGDQPSGLQDDHGFLLAGDDGAEDTRCWHQREPTPSRRGQENQKIKNRYPERTVVHLHAGGLCT